MKVVFGILAALLGIAAVVGGVAIGLGAIAYSIWIIVLMVEGTIAVSFGEIFLVVLCWVLGPFVGWLWGMLCGFLASLCGALSASKGGW